LCAHSFKVTAQLGIDGPVREMRAVHSVGDEGSLRGVFDADEKPKTKGADC
jgi:hypothetical protein